MHAVSWRDFITCWVIKNEKSNSILSSNIEGGILTKAPSCFFGVRGELVAVRGLQNLHGQVYCKIRLDRYMELNVHL
jgi:hypothetical protein